MDSRDRIKAFSKKDLAFVKSISNQTALAIENNILLKEAEINVRVTGQLSRFLAPHVVERMIKKSEVIKQGGQVLTGTVLFVDIRGFTNLSEKTSPGEVVSLLNDYFEKVIVLFPLI